ncbi:MAG: hypothetical protein ACI4RA_08430 [Kiritimatiellia bacterium]
MKLKFELGLVVAVGAAMVSFAADQAWNPTTERAVWNLTALNWDEGAVWANGNNAVFGADAAAKALEVEGKVVVSNLTFSADGYSVGGDGTIAVASATNYPGPISVWSVSNDCAARISAAIGMVDEDGEVVTDDETTWVKGGPGALTLTGPVNLYRMHTRDGRLNLVSNNVTMARLRASNPNSTAEVLLDGASLTALFTPNNAGSSVLLGETTFSNAYIGVGGLAVRGVREGGDYEISQALSTAPGVEQDGGITVNGFGTLRFTATSTFNGGIRVNGGQLRATRSNALGSGPVTFAQGTTFFVQNGEISPPNKLVLDGSSNWMGSTDSTAARLTLSRLGFTDKSNHSLYLGRQNGSFSRVRLSLAEDCEPIRNIVVRGALELTFDGGALVADADSSSPFFTTTQLTVPAVAQVGPDGFVFDSNGANVELGLTLELPMGGKLTNEVEVAGGFANPSFEADASGWTFSHLEGSSFGDGGRALNTSSGFTDKYPSHYTTNGTAYAYVRQRGVLAGSFTVPADGLWCVAFDLGCRPSGEYKGHEMPVTVTIDAGAATEVVTEIPGGRPTRHPFTRYVTVAAPLAAGGHTLRIETGTSTANNTYESLLFDSFRIVRCDVSRIAVPDVVKRGEGSLTVTNLVTDGAVVVSGGTLALRDYTLDDAAVSIADGATLACGAGRLKNAAVTVAAGGTLSLRHGANYVPNGDFEADDVAGSIGFSSVAPHGWAFTVLANGVDASGCQRNGGRVSAGWKRTPSGMQTVYVRNQTRMHGTVSVPEDGAYELSFLRCARNYNESYKLPLTVEVDGEAALELAPQAAYYNYTRESVVVELAAGEHELAFEVGGSVNSGRMLFLDDIRLERMDELAQEIDGATFNLASGATLDLRSGVKIELKGGVFVDGREFRGGRAALQRAGVVVTGPGDIQVGSPLGTVLILR